MRGLLVVADQVKPTSREAVTQLRALGLTPVLLTGDNAAAARTIAAEVGIERVTAEVLPHEKVDAVKALQAEGRAAGFSVEPARSIPPTHEHVGSEVVLLRA